MALAWHLLLYHLASSDGKEEEQLEPGSALLSDNLGITISHRD